MKLQQYLRVIINTKIRPLYIKSECEICHNSDGLHLHHLKLFTDLLDETLEELNLSYKEDTNQYSKQDLINIKEKILGKHLFCEYLTLCKGCHTQQHDTDRMKITNNEKKTAYEHKLSVKKELLRRNNIETVVIPYLESILNDKLIGEHKKELINTINHKVNGKQIKSYRYINNWFIKEELPYQIITKRGTKKRYWKLIKI